MIRTQHVYGRKTWFLGRFSLDVWRLAARPGWKPTRFSLGRRSLAVTLFGRLFFFGF